MTELDYLPTKSRKALAALVSTLLAGLGVALIEDGALTAQEAGSAAGAALLAAYGVWRVRNPMKRPPGGLPADIRRELLRGRP